MKRFMQLLLATFGVFAILAGCTSVDVDEGTTDNDADADNAVVDETATDTAEDTTVDEEATETAEEAATADEETTEEE